MSERRVVITGIGVVSSVGCGVDAFAEALRTGRSAIAPIRSFDTTGFPHYMGGEVQDFDPTRWLVRLDPSSAGRTSQFAAAAARQAADDAGLDRDILRRSAAGSCVGTTAGESQVVERLTAEWLRHGPAGMTPALTRQVSASQLAICVNRELDIHGDAITVATACSAGNYAIGFGYDLVQTGEADYMVCGGADAVARWVHAGFYRLGAIAPAICQPFDRRRQGILAGEGAGMIVLESLDGALARGARIYAEVLGYGLNCDAIHMVAPDARSIAACIRRAHANAGIEPAHVDYVCAHGTGTKTNDVVETNALREVFGDRLPVVSSIKSMLGHTMGAASAMGAIACALALARGFLPPTINFGEPDPDCPVDCVPNVAREADVNVVQNNGFAFGGNNAITILGRHTWVSDHLTARVH
jgi:3-oxoacyl-[acyl-carrier-protein] synthase II